MKTDQIAVFVEGLKADMVKNCNRKAEDVLRMAEVTALYEVAYQLAVMNERNAAAKPQSPE